MPPRIVREGVDEPRIEGSQVTVRQVTDEVHDEGLAPETVADRHGLDIAAVYYALGYYHDNLDEMDWDSKQTQPRLLVSDRRRNRLARTQRHHSTKTPLTVSSPTFRYSMDC